MDEVRGTDYYGQPIDNQAKYLAKQITPIVGQQVWDDLSSGASGSQTAVAAGAQAAGFTARVPTQQDDLDKYVQTHEVTGANGQKASQWSNLSVAQQDQLEQNPDVRKIYDIHARDTQYDLMRQQKFNEVDMQKERDKVMRAFKKERVPTQRELQELAYVELDANEDEELARYFRAASV